MKLQPIGIIKNNTKNPSLVSDKGDLELQKDINKTIKKFQNSNENISEIIINNDLTPFLDGIEDYSHILILYWGHKVSKRGRSLTKVHPAGMKKYPLTGIAATCSPARPNPILIIIVRLCERKNNRLKVAGLDAIDESPVLDIKPYVSDLYPQKNVKVPNWMGKIINDFNENS